MVVPEALARFEEAMREMIVMLSWNSTPRTRSPSMHDDSSSTLTSTDSDSFHRRRIGETLQRSPPIRIPYMLVNSEDYIKVSDLFKKSDVRFTKNTNQEKTKLTFESTEQYLLARSFLEQENINFYSTHMGSKPNQKVIIKGPPPIYSEEYLMETLRRRGCDVVRVVRIQGYTPHSTPMVEVELRNPSNGNNILNLTEIDGLPVKVKVPYRYRRKRAIDDLIDREFGERLYSIEDHVWQYGRFGEWLRGLNHLPPEPLPIKTIKILCWDPEGVIDKTHKIAAFVKRNKIDVVILSPTRLQPRDRFRIENYRVIRTDSIRQNGGVAMYVNIDFKHEVLPEEYDERFEMAGVKLYTNPTSYIKIVGVHSKCASNSDLDGVFNDSHPTLALGKFKANHNPRKDIPCCKEVLIHDYAKDNGIKIAYPKTKVKHSTEFVMVKNFKYSYKVKEISSRSMCSNFRPMLFEVTNIHRVDGNGTDSDMYI